MSLEHSPNGHGDGVGSPDKDADQKAEPPNAFDYWNALIPETPAAEYLNVTDRTMQGWRRQGGGPRYVKISSRCIRYRRADLRAWAVARMRKSTSDPGQGAA